MDDSDDDMNVYLHRTDANYSLMFLRRLKRVLRWPRRRRRRRVRQARRKKVLGEYLSSCSRSLARLRATALGRPYKFDSGALIYVAFFKINYSTDDVSTKSDSPHVVLTASKNL
jgi:hypothetical protein